MAKLGQLYLSGGVYQGVRYLSEEWVKTATSKQVDSSSISPVGKAIDEEVGYGFYFWRNHGVPNSYRCYGREGQFIIVLPEKNAVIATNQTFVIELKLKGEFTNDKATEAFEATKEAVVKQLSDEAKQVLNTAFNDYNSYINSLIEKEVAYNKVSVPAYEVFNKIGY